MALAVVTLPDWISITIGTAALIAAIAVIWKVVRKFSRIIYLVEEYGPVLLQIGEEFKTNGGTSLRDKIDRIEESATEAMRSAAEAMRLANENHVEIAKIATTTLVTLNETVRSLIASKHSLAK